MAVNSLFNDSGKIGIDSAFEKIRNRKVKWTIPAHLKTSLEQSIKRGQQLLHDRK